MWYVEYSARNFRPSFRENKHKTFVFNDWIRAFWACFHEKAGTELCLASSKILTPQPPLHPASVSSSPHQKRGGGGGGTHSPDDGGSIFWKAPDIGLASYSIISLRLIPWLSAKRRGIRLKLKGPSGQSGTIALAKDKPRYRFSNF
jgi:hypothetical protein